MLLNTFRNYQEMVPYNLKPISMDRDLLQKWWLPGSLIRGWPIVKHHLGCQQVPFPNHLWFPDLNFQVQPRGAEIGAGSGGHGRYWRVEISWDIPMFINPLWIFVGPTWSNYVSVFALSGSSIARDCCETGVFLSDPELGLHPNLVGSLMCIN